MAQVMKNMGLSLTSKHLNFPKFVIDDIERIASKEIIEGKQLTPSLVLTIVYLEHRTGKKLNKFKSLEDFYFECRKYLEKEGK